MFEFLISRKVDIFTISTSVIRAGTLAHTTNIWFFWLKLCQLLVEVLVVSCRGSCDRQ